MSLYSPKELVAAMPVGTLTLEEASHPEAAWLGDHNWDVVLPQATRLPQPTLTVLALASVIEHGVEGVYDEIVLASRTSDRTVQVRRGRTIDPESGHVLGPRFVTINREVYLHDTWQPQEMPHGHLGIALADAGMGREHSTRYVLDNAARNRKSRAVRLGIRAIENAAGTVAPETYLAAVYSEGFLNEAEARLFWLTRKIVARRVGANEVADTFEVPETQEAGHGNTYYDFAGDILEDNPRAREVLKQRFKRLGVTQVGTTLIGKPAADFMGREVLNTDRDLAFSIAARTDTRFQKLPGMAGFTPVTDLFSRLAA